MIRQPTRLGSLTAILCVCAASISLAADARRHLLLISIDTLRADYLSCNGSRKVATPHLDRLARGGVNFTRARASAPLTLPSHASILTANHPPTHSVRDNGSYRLPAEQVTVAEVLSRHGYATAAFLGSFVLDHRFGLDQGFDVYDDRVWGEVEMLENLEAERSAEEVLRAFRLWLTDRRSGAPFFVWLHLYDPHAPYTPPEPYRSQHPGDPYSGEVAYVDSVIGQVVAELESRSLLSRAIVAVVGDHGESLGEHGESTHSLLIYNSTLHVPMLIYAPGVLPAGAVVEHLTRTIDLAPTLLDYLGIGAQLGTGMSLRPLIEPGQAGESPGVGAEIVAYSESLYPQLNLGWSPLRGLEMGDYKLILAPRPELFNLAQDPKESVNRVDAEPDLVVELKNRLDGLTADLSISGSEAHRVALDPAAEARLRSLGYLSDSIPAGDGSVSSVDPKDKLSVWNEIQLATYEFAQQAYQDAARRLEKVLATEKDIPLVFEYLGACWMRLNELDSAERLYRAALERGIETSNLRLSLGLIHSRRGELSAAERELRRALVLDELNVRAHFHLADTFRSERRHEDALGHYRRAVEINPAYLWAWNGLGMTLAILGDQQEALQAFRRVVEIDPEGAKGYYNLAAHLERMNRHDEALLAYESLLRLSAEGELPAERQRAAAAVRRLRRRQP